MLLQSIQRAACQLQTLRCLSYGLTSGVPVCSALQPTPAHQQQQQQLHHWQGRQQPEQELEQQRSLLGTVSQQLSPIILPLAARKFTSSSSCGEEQHAAAEQASSQQPDSLQQAQESTEQQLKATFAAMPHSAVQRFVNQPAFWNNLSSNIKGRKPAIKRPARHQWRYCAPDYDPMEPFEARPLPPYASWRAQLKDYNKIYHETKPQFWRNRCACSQLLLTAPSLFLNVHCVGRCMPSQDLSVECCHTHQDSSWDICGSCRVCKTAAPTPKPLQ